MATVVGTWRGTAVSVEVEIGAPLSSPSAVCSVGVRPVGVAALPIETEVGG